MNTTIRSWQMTAPDADFLLVEYPVPELEPHEAQIGRASCRERV